MYEIDKKQIDMTVEEFVKWEVPKGWKMTYINGYERECAPSAYPMSCYTCSFVLSVHLEKEK